jgi:hypothetical protein
MIIVSTSRGLFDLEGGKFFHEGDGPYFGLAQDNKGKLYSICRATNSILIFDKQLELIGKFEVNDCADAHGIEIFENNLFILSTGNNKIIQTDLRGNFIYTHENCIKCSSHSPHINTIKKNGDRLLVMSHRDQIDKGACLYEFNPATKDCLCISRSLGECSHSILPLHGRLWMCDSLGGTVFSVSLKESNPELSTSPDLAKNVHIKTDGKFLLRGLAVDGDSLYLGLSEKACEAERHQNVDGGVAVICAATGHIKERKIIKGGGQVNEILCY